MSEPKSFFLQSYRSVATLNDEHNVVLVQNIYSRKLFVKKELTQYSLPVFQYLREHPIRNMPCIVDFAEENGVLTVIEEYIHGDTLQYVLDNTGALDEKTAMDYGLQLCAILKQLHHSSPAIIHRDIKPGNIIITPDGVVKLLDVNAAKQVHEENRYDTTVLGTVGFAAPEQYGFQQSSIQTDIYALGVLLHVMVTGSLPKQQEPGGKLAPIIRQCTEISPRDRYGSIEEVEDALRRVEKTGRLPANARKPVYRYRWQKYLLPGFRSLSPGKILTSLLLYGLGFGLIFSMTVKGGSVRTQWATRIGMSVITLTMILFNGNYLGLQNGVPGMRTPNQWLRYLMMLLYDFAILIAGLLLIAIGEA